MVKQTDTIMVVDDEVKLSRAISRVLTNAGYHVLLAYDGESALKAMMGKNPLVVLLDLMMPGMNGREVCREIREYSPLTKVIYFTARAEAHEQPELTELRAEADAIITKPAPGAKILAEIKRVTSLEFSDIRRQSALIFKD